MLYGHGDDLYRYGDIRLNFSSNVYSHFDHSGLYAHLAGRLATVTNYPEPAPASLEERLATILSLEPEQVMATNGATEAIYLVAQAYSGRRSAILAPTFSEYADACRLSDHLILYIERLADLPADAQLLWLCNPNNPTGTVVDHDALLNCIDSRPQTLFVIDASYAPFTQRPLLTPAEGARRTNVVMLHSMTKRFAVPGLRLGYVTANAEVIRLLRRRQMPWSIGSLSQLAALYLLEHREDYALPTAQLISECQRMAQALQATGMIDVHPSDTHILLCRLRQGTAAGLKERLARRHGLLIRDAANFRGLTPAHFRIAVQSPEEDDELLRAIECEISSMDK
ncbi:MAG: pyridoxal phosphate-dependent class II aminotransferase [Prevotella sp.]|nr:pyridoxal phosphate-dependent class II aminotransferase [Prevotella sp.]